jgi:hypothetical protein
MKQEEILAAFNQGKRDYDAGRSLNAIRYADKAKDEAWRRGYHAAQQKKAKGR